MQQEQKKHRSALPLFELRAALRSKNLSTVNSPVTPSKLHQGCNQATNTHLKSIWRKYHALHQ
jgi:hypothetical protein